MQKQARSVLTRGSPAVGGLDGGMNVDGVVVFPPLLLLMLLMLLLLFSPPAPHSSSLLPVSLTAGSAPLGTNWTNESWVQEAGTVRPRSHYFRFCLTCSNYTPAGLTHHETTFKNDTVKPYRNLFDLTLFLWTYNDSYNHSNHFQTIAIKIAM